MIAIISYVINISQAKLFAKKSNYTIDSNQVCLFISFVLEVNPHIVCRICFLQQVPPPSHKHISGCCFIVITVVVAIVTIVVVVIVTIASVLLLL